MHFIHIAMWHGTPFSIEAKDSLSLERTVRSQLLVAKAIKQCPNCPIVYEGACENTTKDNFNSSIASSVKALFPKGLPQEFSELNPWQKDYLYDMGAVHILYYLGEIPSIYRAIPGKKTRDILAPYQPLSYTVTFNIRERMLMKCVKEAAVETFGSIDRATVLVVYGGGHNFRPYCEKARFTHEKIDAMDVSPAGCGEPRSSMPTLQSVLDKMHKSSIAPELKSPLEQRDFLLSSSSGLFCSTPQNETPKKKDTSGENELSAKVVL